MHSFLRAGGVYDGIADAWLPYLEDAAKRFEINTRLRQIHWVATMVHESMRFTRFVENLNYSAQALFRLFPLTPHRPWGFTAQEAADYARKPEAIANRIYADRNGNGNEASGEGWLYRGRGPIQITFRDNYRVASVPCGVDLEAEPELLIEPKYGAIASGHFWHLRRCNELADQDKTEAIRHAINGGTIGLDEVRLLVDRMKHA